MDQVSSDPSATRPTVPKGLMIGWHRRWHHQTNRQEAIDLDWVESRSTHHVNQILKLWCLHSWRNCLQMLQKLSRVVARLSTIVNQLWTTLAMMENDQEVGMFRSPPKRLINLSSPTQEPWSTFNNSDLYVWDLIQFEHVQEPLPSLSNHAPIPLLSCL